MIRLDANYWDNRYRERNSPWDLGKASRPLVEYMQTLPRDARILIPGGGMGHELAWLFRNGFEQVYQLDISSSALQGAQQLYPDVPYEHWLREDFFAHTARYDYILEQTFFCALDPAMRPQYAEKVSSLLRKGGTLAGVLFEFPLTEKGPPYGGHRTEYYKHLSPHFERILLQTAQNSEPERMGKEVWVEAVT